MNIQEELIDAFETIKYYVEKDGECFHSDEKHFNFEGKQITYTLATNIISIRNVYPTTSEGLQGDVDIMEYTLEKSGSNHIVYWRDDLSIKPTDRVYDKIVSDIISTAKNMRYYTIDHSLLDPGQQESSNGLTLKLNSRENNSSTVIVSHQNETKTLIISNTNMYNSYFEGFHIKWDKPDSMLEKHRYSVAKKHKLPVWNYFLESKFEPTLAEANKRVKAVYEVANKWEIPIKVQFIVSSLSDDPEIQKSKFIPIINQNQKVFAVYDNHFERDWKTNFDKEVEKIKMK